MKQHGKYLADILDLYYVLRKLFLGDLFLLEQNKMFLTAIQQHSYSTWNTVRPCGMSIQILEQMA